MKKIGLLFTAVLMGLTSVTAAEKNSALKFEDLDNTSRYRYTQPVTFVERGVEFLIFADGSFDFNTPFYGNSTRRSGLYFEGNTRRGSINVAIGAPGRVNNHYGSRGTLVLHDRFGRVDRVGNVFIDYDRWGRVKRVGSVYVSYRNGYLRQVGNLRLQYNGKGRLIHTRGFVNNSNRHCNDGLMDWNRNRDRWDDDYRDWDDNDDFYYFKHDGKMKKHKKLKSKGRR